MGSPLGQSCRAIVWLKTATGAPRIVSVRSHRRPCERGIRRTVKYSGLMKLTRTVGFSDEPELMISIRESLPFAGGVALVDMPAATTWGMAAIRERICSKYSD